MKKVLGKYDEIIDAMKLNEIPYKDIKEELKKLQTEVESTESYLIAKKDVENAIEMYELTCDNILNRDDRTIISEAQVFLVNKNDIVKNIFEAYTHLEFE